MFVPHPGIETEEKAVEMLREEFLDILSDVTFPSLKWLLSMRKKMRRKA